MQLNIGNKIRELRHRDRRTQEMLADALGVTSQAVSRWESGGSYPDMEIVPAIANYFGVSIDHLFGYDNDRQVKINTILDKAHEYNLHYRNDGIWFDECLTLLRNGLAEFPDNESIMIELADTLSEMGWRRYGEHLYYDEQGFIQHDHQRHVNNPYWQESIKICEHLAENTTIPCFRTRAVSILVMLYRNIGRYDKAIAHATNMPGIQQCREYLLADGTDGKQQAAYIGQFLLCCAKEFAEQLIFGLIANSNNFESDMPIDKVKGAIANFDLICDDGNMGEYHDFVAKLYLYLSRLQYARGYCDDAFVSLDMALEHEKAYEAVFDGSEHSLTAPLVSFVRYTPDHVKGAVKDLAADWPFWCYPDFSDIEEEIKADPRWAAWVNKLS